MLFPHAALDSPHFYRMQGSQESLNSESSYTFFTPPARKPNTNVFFNSDDSLYKSELRKLNVPRIQVQNVPVFNLQVTDFSEPLPKDVTAECEFIQSAEDLSNDSKINKKNKPSNFMQSKSQSLDVTEIPSIQIELIGDTDTNFSSSSSKLTKPIIYSSLQDLSSSTSSINSCIHESNLDLSSIDPDTPIKHRNWKSPNEIRKGHVKSVTRHFEEQFANKGTIAYASSVPELTHCFHEETKKYYSEEKLNNKLTEFERLEILKLLHDWSTQGSEAKDTSRISFEFSSFKVNTDISNPNSNNVEHKEKKPVVKCISEPNLSPKQKYKTENREKSIFLTKTKYMSENDVHNKNILESDFLHKCKFQNCIFNADFNPSGTKVEEKPPEKLKGILKTYPQNKVLKQTSRRNSEIIHRKPFIGPISKCDSLERLSEFKNKSKENQEIRKFPESYIVRRSKQDQKSVNNRNESNISKSPSKTTKVVVLRKTFLPKTWRSCSDIKHKQRTVRKCCRNAKKTCPVYRSSASSPRKAKSCVEILKSVENCTASEAEKTTIGLYYRFSKTNDYIGVALFTIHALCILH